MGRCTNTTKVDPYKEALAFSPHGDELLRWYTNAIQLWDLRVLTEEYDREFAFNKPRISVPVGMPLLDGFGAWTLRRITGRLGDRPQVHGEVNFFLSFYSSRPPLSPRKKIKFIQHH